MLNSLIKTVTLLSIIFVVKGFNSIDNFKKRLGKSDEEELFANIVSAKDSRLAKFKAVQKFLKKPNGVDKYQNVNVKYVPREKEVTMTVHKGSFGGEIVKTVKLSDYTTEEDLDELFSEIGLEKTYLDEKDVQRALDRMKRDAEEAYRKKREELEKQGPRKRELDGASELRAEVEKSRLVMERKKRLEEEAKMKTEMEMKEKMEDEERTRMAHEAAAADRAKRVQEAMMKAHEQDAAQMASQHASIRADL